MLENCVSKSYLFLLFSGRSSYFFLLFDENSYFFLLFWCVLLLDTLHMLCVPILPVYLLSVSVYSCIIFIWDMKQTYVGEGCNFEVIAFDYISISLKDIF